MEEKKLTDEKAMFNHIANTVLGEVKPLYLRKRIVTEILDLIHRLQENNANQVRMRCDMQRKFDDLQTLCTEQKAEIERMNNRIVDMEFVGKGNCMDCKLVEDIYTLDTKYNELKEKTFSYETELLELREDRERFRARNAELLKQVDELNKNIIARESVFNNLVIVEKYKSVKITAKEILTLAEDYNCGKKDDIDNFMLALKERYGVEVE